MVNLMYSPIFFHFLYRNFPVSIINNTILGDILVRGGELEWSGEIELDEDENVPAEQQSPCNAPMRCVSCVRGPCAAFPASEGRALRTSC